VKAEFRETPEKKFWPIRFWGVTKRQKKYLWFEWSINSVTCLNLYVDYQYIAIKICNKTFKCFLYRNCPYFLDALRRTYCDHITIWNAAMYVHLLRQVFLLNLCAFTSKHRWINNNGLLLFPGNLSVCDVSGLMCLSNFNGKYHINCLVRWNSVTFERPSKRGVEKIYLFT